ncbi:relaxase/mobilization nuclease domain-containing protein [Bengtsoniella intestinalis]|uniref:relaxase/mobilization nuclease domain-containing protein n=1 Tax=Bengtsoniella intestinalis TaxID=3073143 RepID=UPI00391FBA48
MATTKILAGKGNLRKIVSYATCGEKTCEQVLVYAQNCLQDTAADQMVQTKVHYGKTSGVQYYHMMQSFAPGEIAPELALEIGKEFAKEHLSDYEVVLGVHVDRAHIHVHMVFNSVSVKTGKKYHSNKQSYYSQIRTISDRLCREHGLSVIVNGTPTKTMSYIEWLRLSKKQPTFRSMLEADLQTAMADAVDFGNFLMLMEHMGYEVKHGQNIGFRLRGQERFQKLGRRNPQYTEDGIRATIEGNWVEVEQGRKPVTIQRPRYVPYQKRPKYKGFLALYVHYLYVLGKIEKQEYPPKMTPTLKASIMEFERYRDQFAFLRDHNITTKEEMGLFMVSTEETLSKQTKHRTILNVQKKRRADLFAALADVESLAPAQTLQGMEQEVERYRQAVALLDSSDIPMEQLIQEKQSLYSQLADINRDIRETRKTLAICKAIEENTPRIQRELQQIETEREVKNHDNRRR